MGTRLPIAIAPSRARVRRRHKSKFIHACSIHEQPMLIETDADALIFITSSSNDISKDNSSKSDVCNQGSEHMHDCMQVKLKCV